MNHGVYTIQTTANHAKQTWGSYASYGYSRYCKVFSMSTRVSTTKVTFVLKDLKVSNFSY